MLLYRKVPADQPLYDVVMAADCLYEEDTLDSLVRTILATAADQVWLHPHWHNARMRTRVLRIHVLQHTRACTHLLAHLRTPIHNARACARTHTQVFVCLSHRVARLETSFFAALRPFFAVSDVTSRSPDADLLHRSMIGIWNLRRRPMLAPPHCACADADTQSAAEDLDALD